MTVPAGKSYSDSKKEAQAYQNFVSNMQQVGAGQAPWSSRGFTGLSNLTQPVVLILSIAGTDDQPGREYTLLDNWQRVQVGLELFANKSVSVCGSNTCLPACTRIHQSHMCLDRTTQ